MPSRVGSAARRQAHYSERLVRLPGLSTLFDPPEPPTLARPYRAALRATLARALPDDAVQTILGGADGDGDDSGDDAGGADGVRAAGAPAVFVAPHSLFKLDPSFDEARAL